MTWQFYTHFAVAVIALSVCVDGMIRRSWVPLIGGGLAAVLAALAAGVFS